MASILIVDDDEDIRELLKYNLERHNHTVRAVENGLKCLEAVASEKPDLILLDITMPKMDGFEVLRRLREDAWGKDAKVIMLTAMDDFEKISTRGNNVKNMNVTSINGFFLYLSAKSLANVRNNK